MTRSFKVNISAPSIIKDGGTSSQFLMADGSIRSGQVTVSETAPSSPSNGDLWFSTVDGSLYSYYVDGTSNQWIEVGDVGSTQEIAASTSGVFGLPGVNVSGTSTQLLSANFIYYNPIVFYATQTLNEVGIRVTSAASTGGLIRIALYNANADWTAGTLVADLGTVAVDSLGFKSITGLTQKIPAGRYSLRIHSDSSATQATLAVQRGHLSQIGAFIIAGSGQYNYTQWAGRTFGVAESPGQTVTVGSGAGSTTGGFFYFPLLRWS